MHDDTGVQPLEPAEHGVSLQLLGAPEIQIAGAALAVRDQKALALLCYLAATGKACTRGRLATLLWSESPESNARHSLRSSLYHLRHTLDSRAVAATLEVDRNLVRLHLRDAACDVIQFRQLIATHSEPLVAEALSLYRGPLLEGFTVPDAPVFEDWLRTERDSLHQLCLDALDRLATWAESREAWGEAVAYFQRIVQMDAFNEAAQQRLMRLQMQHGSSVQALRQYQHFEALLKREFGVMPSPETQELFQRILRPSGDELSHILTTPPTTTPALSGRQTPEAGRSDDDSTLPLVGREALLARLFTISQGVRAGQGATVVLHGETGIGKTRLVHEVATALAGQSPPWTVLRGSCSPFDDLLSYGPFYDALQNAAIGDLSDLLIVDPAHARAEAGTLMLRVLQILRLLSRGGPLLLAIDDLHWANSSTLQLFGFLATRLQNSPILLVGTLERADAIPEVQRLLALGRPRGDVHIAPVTPLPLAAVLALLQALGLSPDSAASLAEWLHERSGGRPYLIGEILAQLSTDGVLTPSGSGLHLNESRWLHQRISFTLPETAFDLVAWRLASLSPTALLLLDVLAVAGQPLPFALLRDFAGAQNEHPLQLVDDLLTRGLLIEVSGNTFTLPHHLLRETLLLRLSQLRRRDIHRQLLEALEQCPALQAHFSLRQMALHAVAAEDTDRARRYGLQTLDDVALDAPNAETLTFARNLHDLLMPTASTDERLRLTRGLGHLHQSLGQLEAAAHWQREQMQIARTVGDRAAQAIAYFDMSELALVTSDYMAAVATAEAGLTLCNPAHGNAKASLVGRGYRLLGAALAMEGRNLGSAQRHLQLAADAHRSAGDLSDLCSALFELGNVAAQRGDLERALASYEEATLTAEAGRVYYYHALAHNNYAYHSLLLGRLEAAQAAAAQGLRLAEAHELVGALLHLYSTLGEIHLYSAEWSRAADWFYRGLALAEDLGNLERQAGYRAGLALVMRGEHDLEGATALLEEALALIALPGHYHLRTRIQLWLAELWLLRDSLSNAQPYVEIALATARTQERAVLLIQGERLHARLLATSGNWPEANVLFASACDRAAHLGLPLEVARTQAVWGEAASRSASSIPSGRTLLVSARQTFTEYHARADLQALSVALHV